MEKDKEKISMDKMLIAYLTFKKICVDYNIFDIDEIIKLFEVWIKSNE